MLQCDCERRGAASNSHCIAFPLSRQTIHEFFETFEAAVRNVWFANAKHGINEDFRSSVSLYLIHSDGAIKNLAILGETVGFLGIN
jgi:hypothetical protein